MKLLTLLIWCNMLKQWILDFPNAVGIVDEEGRARIVYTDKGHASHAFDITSLRGERLIAKIKRDGIVIENTERRRYVRNKS